MAEQSDDTTTEQTNASTEDNTIYDQVDIMPYFPGGPGKMMSFRIDKTLVYPKAAQEYGIHGIVVVDFVVNKDGSLSDVQAKGSVDSSLGDEAVRIVKSMPQWIPGTQNGVPVRVRYNVSITFSL